MFTALTNPDPLSLVHLPLLSAGDGIVNIFNSIAGILNTITIGLGILVIAKIALQIGFGGGVAGDDHSVRGAFSSAKWWILSLVLALGGTIINGWIMDAVRSGVGGGGGGGTPTPTGFIIPDLGTIAQLISHISQHLSRIIG